MTPSIQVNGVACIRYSIKALSLEQLVEAARRTFNCPVVRTTRAYMLAELESMGYVFAANPGTGIVLLKQSEVQR